MRVPSSTTASFPFDSQAAAAPTPAPMPAPRMALPVMMPTAAPVPAPAPTKTMWRLRPGRGLIVPSSSMRWRSFVLALVSVPLIGNSRLPGSVSLSKVTSIMPERRRNCARTTDFATPCTMLSAGISVWRFSSRTGSTTRAVKRSLERVVFESRRVSISRISTVPAGTVGDPAGICCARV